MTQYLLVLSIGPVQTMIAAARRSRDLWSGSWLLSELSKACALSLYNNTEKATLIFPHIDDASQLAENSSFSVGNKIQAKVDAPNTEALIKVINEAKEAVQQRFKDEATKSLARLSENNDIRKDIWDAQIEDYLEIQCAWVDLSEYSYSAAVKLLGKSLAARKATREFDPSALTPYDDGLMIPKSSLDGMRETVLKETEGRRGQKVKLKTRRQLSLSDSEQLDSLGVIKRLGFDEKNAKGKKVVEQFTPISRVAADAWIQQVLAEDIAALDTVKIYYDELVKQGVATRVEGNEGIYQDFAFDGQYLYASRIEAETRQLLKNSLADETSDSTAIINTLENLQKQLKPLWKTYGQPATYFVLLLADGDKMGKLLDNATNEKQHQAITAALSDFAQSVAEVMRSHRGHCIYAGGDDVLGFVPLHHALACANDLRLSFFNILKKIATDLNADTPTLSVGLAICHVMTPFSVVREQAKVAEKVAKGDGVDASKRRNALGILLSVRSGADTQLRIRWDNKDEQDFLKKWQQAYENNQIDIEKKSTQQNENDFSLPSRVAYDIQDIYLRTQSIASHNEDKQLNQKIQLAELTRMLKQARTRQGDKLDNKVVDALVKRGEDIGLDKLADELIVARWLAIKTQQDLGKE